ncbi:serine hydrolase domain-containing protein [Christiangramia aestuarii]|uniref:Serine hydrolase n=1 Tax=Christiangramia aestuarii TaxID=1028746 RepID=A0A7K1LQC1_9FLAO|nr:serine hydrolase domain-containing protein [Christiangramia aestuarii]MUP42958.1 serine hydrolase [Christiangramia aestuarii]
MIYRNFFIVILAFFSLNTFGQEIPAEVETEIQRRTQLEINPSMSIGLLLPGGETRFYNYGKLDDSGKKADSLTFYEIGSITKTFTAYLAKEYLQEDLNTSLAFFFPEIKNKALQNTKIFQLRNHTSGVPRLSDNFSPANWADPYQDYSNEKLNTELEDLKFVADSLKSWSYSNFGYGILGRTIEKKTGKDFESLMGDFLDEAGLKKTVFDHSSLKDAELATPTNIGIKNFYWHLNGPSKYAGALISNTSDLIEYLKFQKRNNEIFSSELISEAIPTGIRNMGHGELYFKEGWFIMKPEPGTEILIHNGGTGGFTSFTGYNKSTGTGVVILSNSVSLNDDIGLKLIYPEFNLNRPQRSIAYDLAEFIEMGKTEDLLSRYKNMKNEGKLVKIVDIYWLERLNYGKGNWEVSDQLSDIMVLELPEDWEVWDIKGQNKERLQDYESAAEAYQKALGLAPDNAQLQRKIEKVEKQLN